MKIIHINENNFVESVYVHDATIEIKVTDEKYDQLTQFPFNKNWKYLPETNDFVLVDLLDTESLKQRRQNECFSIIDNRSKFWYDSLTKEQYNELQEWYKAWLKVTETKIIPVKPEWLY